VTSRLVAQTCFQGLRPFAIPKISDHGKKAVASDEWQVDEQAGSADLFSRSAAFRYPKEQWPSQKSSGEWLFAIPKKAIGA
jgi:hypothetical protein